MHTKLIPILGLVACILLNACSSSTEVEKTNEKFISEKGKFSILFPGTPTVEEQTAKDFMGEILSHQIVYTPSGGQDHNLRYEVDFIVYPKEFADTLSRKTIYGLFSGILIDLLKDPELTGLNLEDIELHGHLGREFNWLHNKDELFLKVRMYFAGNTLYMISVKTPKKNNFNVSSKKFMDSFELADTTRSTKYNAGNLPSYQNILKAGFGVPTEVKNWEIMTEYGNAKCFLEAFQPKLVNDENLAYCTTLVHYPVDVASTKSFNLTRFYDDVIATALTNRQSTLISKKNVTFKGMKGVEYKESFKEHTIIIVSRSFLIGDKLCGVNVMTIPENDQNASMMKFLHSLEIKK